MMKFIEVHEKGDHFKMATLISKTCFRPGFRHLLDDVCKLILVNRSFSGSQISRFADSNENQENKANGEKKTENENGQLQQLLNEKEKLIEDKDQALDDLKV